MSARLSLGDPRLTSLPPMGPISRLNRASSPPFASRSLHRERGSFQTVTFIGEAVEEHAHSHKNEKSPASFLGIQLDELEDFAMHDWLFCTIPAGSAC